MRFDLTHWTQPPRPHRHMLKGGHVYVVPWERQRHAHSIWSAFGESATNALLFHFGWPHMQTADDLADQLDAFNVSGAFITFAFEDPATGHAMGMASYMNIVVEHGRVEVGAVAHGTPMRQSRAATEAHYLMARHIFDLGYRRYEWKLNNPNVASHKAAQRLGFTFEGVFRQHEVKPYGNRDTAWYSLLDTEWPSRRQALEIWLDDANFDGDGRQRRTLAHIRGDLEETETDPDVRP